MADVCLPIAIPLVKQPKVRRAKTPVSLRRSVRLATKPREPNATLQAQKVLLQKLGVRVDENAVPADIVAQFNAAFKGDMTVRKQERLNKLLGGGFDVTMLDLNLTGLEEELSA